jgi:hypothetical protein
MAAALPFVALAGSAVSAFGQMQAGKAQAKGLAQQAALAQVQARGEALKYRQQGVETLKNIVRTNSTLNARAAAGGIDPFSGSALGLAQFTQSEGAKEFFVTEDNQIIAREGGAIQAKLYMDQAKQAKRGAMFAAAGTLLSSAGSFSKIGGPPSPGANVSYATSGPGGAGLLV